ncbi:hypothetical protein ACQ4PT_015265 [Festuca glaucescens]
MDIRAVQLASHPAEVLGENFPTQSLDWNVIEVESMDSEGLNQPMAEDLMCNLLGIEDHAEEEATPLSDVDEVSEHELVQPEMGDDEIGESLLEEAAIPVDDEVTSELVITYDPDQPVILVGTYFANMDEFRKAFGQFCINGEFDVRIYRNTKERFEAKCKLEYNNGDRVNKPCPWQIAARQIPSGETIRVNKMGPPHMCPTGYKLKSSMATQELVEKHALAMLKKTPNESSKKRKPRCKTADAVFVLHDEARFEWTDDNEGTDLDWPDIPEPSEPAYKKARKLSPRRKKIVETPKMSGQPKKNVGTEVVG